MSLVDQILGIYYSSALAISYGIVVPDMRTTEAMKLWHSPESLFRERERGKEREREREKENERETETETERQRETERE